MNKSIRQAKLPTKPELPPSLMGYQSMFTSYSRELLKYYSQTTLSLALLFSDGVGAFQHLFIVSGVELPYLCFMTACYHLGFEGNTIRRAMIRKLTTMSWRTVDRYYPLALQRGHLEIWKPGYYILSEDGREYVEEQGRIFYDGILDLYGMNSGVEIR